MASLLRTGFTCGFRLGCVGPRIARDAHNLASVKSNPALALSKLDKEVSLGRMAGPFQGSPIANLRISPIGLVPKTEPGCFRLIHHLSHPEMESVNDGIDKQLCSVRYTSFDNAVNLVVGAGEGALMAKAFRLLPNTPMTFASLA